LGRTLAVLFDLDGTLADTAPDLGGALNQLRIDRGLEPLPLAKLRPYVSQGARGLIQAGLDMLPDHPEYPVLQQRFLDIYASTLCVHTRLFDGMDSYLDALDAEGIPWGVVTNKSTRFTVPLMEGLRLHQRAGCIVCGDSAPRAKPYPDPMFLACETLGIAADCCVYVGDDERDVIAGRAAGMKTIAAAWGYLGDAKPITEWGADAIVDLPKNLPDAVAAMF
jgi:phosphoglycolate phosphatase